MRALAGFLLAFVLAGHALAAEPFDPFGQAKVAPPANARAPMSGAFLDQRGHAATLEALAHGRPVVLIPVQYLCPNLCGLSLVGLDRAIARQPDRGFAVAALGIDPREGPAVAAKAIADLTTPVVALTGPEANSRAVTDALGYRYAWDETLKQYAHISAVAVLTPDGGLVRWLPGPQIDPKALTLALEQARTGQTETGQTKTGKPEPIPERLFLLCYHLLAPGNANDHRVLQGLRIGGAVIVGLLLLLVGGLIVRQGRRATR